ncbi:hypothetical protein H6P81_003105 [Aristolochia fimbriata]|uniref:Plantacyanin n=1 Tax=Aristolochia fimbriata TaxID=158543 RepID=A0AAV7FFU4_ARIFI|nr:hypothetical protein H6P81_003105 [Aristolochia fimbriata]
MQAPRDEIPSPLHLLLDPILCDEYYRSKIDMGQGRGSASGSSAIFAVAAILLIVLNAAEMVHATTFTVGDKGGWTFNVVNWPNGKRFKAADVLVFNYGSSLHNVVALDGKSYNTCTTPKGAKIYTSGHDRITLRRGKNYFICNFPGHCQGGMKIAVNAA